jgi:hypothetical protein
MLTIIQCLQSGKLISILLHEGSKLRHQNAMLSTRRMKTPGGVEGFIRSLDGKVDVLGRTFGDGRYYLSICCQQNSCKILNNNFNRTYLG